jgi:hypothetical protein
MSDDKYVGMDVHQASCVIEVLNSDGKTIMQTIIETKEKSIREFFLGLRGTVHVVTRGSAEYEFVKGRIVRRPKALATRGLNVNYNRTMKEVFKSASVGAIQREPFKSYYQALIEKGLSREIA